jgi:ribosome recycling factor
MLALTLLRRTTCKRTLPCLISASQKTAAHISQTQIVTRSYAKRRQALDEDADTDVVHHKGKKGKQGKDIKHAEEVILDKNNITDPTLRFVPSSSMPHGAAYDTEEKRADEKMVASVRWLKETARGVEVRSSGRVVPDVLDAVKVRIKLDEEGESDDEMEVGLKEVASVGVKNGNVLVVTVFEEQVSMSLGCFLTELLTPCRRSRR